MAQCNSGTQFSPPCYKIASASLTDDNLLRYHRRTGRPLIVSTGMSSLEQIDHAVDVLGDDGLVLAVRLMQCRAVVPTSAVSRMRAEASF